MNKDFALLWTDLETPGLEHDEPWSAIFEAGFTLTDAKGRILEEFEIIPEYPSNFLDYAFERMDDVCKRMHAKSGLIDAMRKVQMPDITPVDEYERMLPAESYMQGIRTYPMMRAMYRVQEWMEECGIEYGSHRLTMAGASSHFDRRWLANFWPSVEEGFHYRNFDISTIRKAVALLRPDLMDFEPERTGTHRALGDIREAINYYKWAQDNFFIKGGDNAGAS